MVPSDTLISNNMYHIMYGRTVPEGSVVLSAMRISNNIYHIIYDRTAPGGSVVPVRHEVDAGMARRQSASRSSPGDAQEGTSIQRHHQKPHGRLRRCQLATRLALF